MKGIKIGIAAGAVILLIILFCSFLVKGLPAYFLTGLALTALLVVRYPDNRR
ncbi:MAG: hypothetical protein ACXVPQ_01155 [Bacteroidia bacterium]